MTNCLICLTDFDDGEKFTCCDSTCMEYVCVECIKLYVDVSERENSLLACPRQSCKGVFDEKCIPRSLVDTYRKLLYSHYQLVKSADITESRKQQLVIEIVRKEKTKFLVESLPKAVSTVAAILFKNRITKVKKQQKERELGRISRTCINLVCNGFLNENYTCSICYTKFCKLCEETKEDDHVCDDHIAESVKFINSMVKCPTCSVPIQKSEGCMAMTCAVCQTHFWYNTGEKSDVGNHGQSVPVNARTTERVSAEYQHFLPPSCCIKIRALESQIKDVDDDRLVDMMLRRERNSESEKVPLMKFLHRFSETYSDIVRTKLNNATVIKKLSLIENMLKARREGYLDKILTLLDDKRVSCSYFKRDDKNGLVTYLLHGTKSFAGIYEASEEMRVTANEIRKSIELGDGIYEGLFWEYE